MSRMEQTTIYTANVSTLQDAFSFVMDHVYGYERPGIDIKPFSTREADEEDWHTEFSVRITIREDKED